MATSPRVRRFAPDEWRTYRDLRLRALAESPDAFGSTLALERARPDAEWARRLDTGARSSSELPLVAERGGDAVGLAWGRLAGEEPGVAHLYQVWVAPQHRGHGVGRLLLDAVVAWARAAGAHTLALDVTCGDTPAMRLYTRAGCQPAGELAPLRPGSPLQVQPLRLALDRAAASSA
jgi:ribosomal protein S18 acetylase RimI-like enzyme